MFFITPGSPEIYQILPSNPLRVLDEFAYHYHEHNPYDYTNHELFPLAAEALGTAERESGKLSQNPPTAIPNNFTGA